MSSYASSSSGSSTCSEAVSDYADSIFSHMTTSTASTSYETHFPDFRTAGATSIHLPTRLPEPPTPFAEVELASLAVDPEFQGLPIGFVVAKLQKLGPELLNASTNSRITIPPGSFLPPYLSCPHAPTTSTLTSAPYTRPSHILAIRAPDAPRTLLLPVHGLLWASKSPALSLLSSAPEFQKQSSLLPSSLPPSDTSIPVLELTLPSTLAVPLLQGWIYLASPQILLSTILPAAPRPESSLEPLLNPAPQPKSPRSLALALSYLPSRTLLDRVSLVHGLWQNVVALEISDPALWSVMSGAWSVLIGALGLREQRRLAAERVQRVQVQI
ncbi:hypothetical protein P7C70_g3331, partial [Phenoliferia sp. Uapishka_3]